MSAVHYDVAGIRAAGKKMHASANAQAMALAETDRDRTFVRAQDACNDFLRWFHAAAMNDPREKGVGETVALSPVPGGHA